MMLVKSWLILGLKKIEENNQNNIVNLNLDLSFLKSYQQTNTFKKIVLTFITTRLTENDINDLNKLFVSFDKDNDGQISFDEFKQGLLSIKSEGIKSDEIIEIFNSLDSDKNGKIDYTEFIASCIQKQTYLKKERLYEAFSFLI